MIAEARTSEAAKTLLVMKIVFEMKTVFENGKVKNQAECDKCKRKERRPSDFN